MIPAAEARHLPLLRPPRNPVLRTEPLSVSRLRKYAECPDAFYRHYIRRKTRRCGAVWGGEGGPYWWWDGGGEGEVCERPVLQRPPCGTTCERGHANAPILEPEKTVSVRTSWWEDTAEPATVGKIVHRVLDELHTRAVIYEDGRFDRDWATARYDALYTGAGLRGPDAYRDGLAMLRSYLSRYPDAELDTLVASELEFKIVYGGYVFYGLLDLVRCQDQRYRVSDYKSNRLLYTDAEIKTDVQLGCYAYVVHRLFGAEEVDVAFEMLRHDVSQIGKRTLPEMIEAMDYLVAIARAAEMAETFPAVLQGNCPWCDYRTGCAEYRRAGTVDPDEIIGAIATEDWDKLALQRSQLKAIERIVEKRLKIVDDAFAARLDREGSFEAGGYRHEYSVFPKRDYPIEEVNQLLVRHGVEAQMDRYAVVYKKRLDEYVSSSGISPKHARLLRAQLEGISVPTKQRPWINSWKPRK